METLHLYWSDPLYFDHLWDEEFEERLENCGVNWNWGIYMVTGGRKIMIVFMPFQTSCEVDEQSSSSIDIECVSKSSPSNQKRNQSFLGRLP